MDKMKTSNSESNKTSIIARLFGISFFFILLSRESTFSIQSIIIIIIATIIFFAVRGMKAKLDKTTKCFCVLIGAYTISTFINIIRHQLGETAIIQIVYQIVIFLWYALITGISYAEKDIKFVNNSFIYTCVICSIIVLVNNLIFNKTIFAITSLFGYQIDKNFFSNFICLAAILSFRNILYGKSKVKYIICFSLMSLCIIFCNSRSSILALIVGVLFSIIIYLKDKITVRKLIVSILLCCIAIFVAMNVIKIIPKWMYDRYFVSSYKDNSNTDRISMWRNALQGFYNQPILGFGPGNLPSIPEYSITSFGRKIETNTISHNTYIDVLVNGGIVGTSIFIIFLFCIFKDTFKYDKSLIPLVLILIFVSFIVGAGKSVFFWNTLIFMKIESDFIKNKERIIE